MKHLNNLEILGSLAVALQFTGSLRHGVTLQHLADHVMVLQSEEPSGDLATVAAHVLTGIVDLEPVEAAGPAHCERRRQAGVELATAIAAEWLRKNGRETDHKVWRNPDIVESTHQYVMNSKFGEKLIAKCIGKLVPADEWSVAVTEPMAIGHGLSILIGAPVTGTDVTERSHIRIIEDNLVADLLAMGFDVIRHVDHPESEDCRADCRDHRNVDLFIAIAKRPSTRLGHQVGDVADLLGLTLALVGPDVKDVSCIFKAPEHGLVRIARYSTAADARDIVRSHVESQIGLLRMRSEAATSFAEWHTSSFLELRERVQQRLGSGAERTESSIITKPRVMYMINSLDNYSASSIALIDAVRDTVGLPPLAHRSTNPFESLFSREQIWELDQLVEAGEIPAADRTQLMESAARGCVGVGRGTERRTRNYTGPNDWIGEYRAMQSARGGRR
jgi:hypothetical protein